MLRFCKWFMGLMLITIAVGGLGIYTIFCYYGKDLPDYKQLNNYKPPIVTRFYAGNGQVFAEYAYEKRIYVPLTAISPIVKQAFLSAEDKNFYHHRGLDYSSIISAGSKNLAQLGSSKRPKGASTITQQVAKNFLLSDISTAVSYDREIKEAILSFRIEKTYSKDYILELYLNAVYLGAGSYGVAAAALNYFNKSLDELTPSQAAFLAALPKAPSRYNPVTNEQQTLIRRNWVLKRMYEDQYLSKKQFQQAQLEPFQLSERRIKGSVNGHYFAEEVRRDLIKRFGEKALYQDGYVVRTTLDPHIQTLAEQSLKQGLIEFDQARGFCGPISHIELDNNQNYLKDKSLWIEALKGINQFEGLKPWRIAIVLNTAPTEIKIGLQDGMIGTMRYDHFKWADRGRPQTSTFNTDRIPRKILNVGDIILVDEIDKKSAQFRLCQIPQISGAIVVIEPQTGRVLAMQGGFDFSLSQFNRATQALRQPGSAFKPFVCLAMLENGYTPNTVLYDEPFAIDMGSNLGIYKPHNWDDEFKGSITLRRSFELSRNVAVIRAVYEKVGMKKISQIAKRFNINNNMPYQLSSVLGATETTVLKLTAAYAMLANGGKLIVPRFFDHIQDRYGKTVLVNAHFECLGCTQNDMDQLPHLKDLRPRVTDSSFAYQVTSILRGAVERGLATFMKDLKYPVAVKSGTTNDFKDAWMVGYSPDLAVGIYIGYDQPRTLGHKQFGSVVAGPIFKQFIKQVLPLRVVHEFKVPENIEFVPVNADTGELTSSDDPRMLWESFIVKNKIISLDANNDHLMQGQVSEIASDPWKIIESDASRSSENADASIENNGEPIESSSAELQGIY